VTVLCLGAWQYGKDCDYDALFQLLDKLLHSMSQSDDEQLVVVSEVLYLGATFVLDVFVSWIAEHCFSLVGYSPHP